MGEDRGGMPVVSQPKDHHIEDGILAIEGKLRADKPRLIHSLTLGVLLPCYAMDLPLGNGDMTKEGLLGHPIVTLGIRRGHTPLIYPVEMHTIPLDGAC